MHDLPPGEGQIGRVWHAQTLVFSVCLHLKLVRLKLEVVKQEKSSTGHADTSALLLSVQFYNREE